MHEATDDPCAFIEVPAQVLCSDDATTFPIFLRTTQRTQPLLYRPEGSCFDEAALADLKSKEVEYVLVPETASKSYHSRIESSLEQVAGDESLTVEDRAQILVSTASYAVGEIFRDGFDDPAWRERAKSIASATARLIVRDHASFLAVRQVLGVGTVLARHSVNVSVLAVALAAALRPSEAEWAAEVGLGGLLHDVGRVGQPEAAEPADFDSDGEILRAEDPAHCARGASILEEQGFSSVVVSCARQHHERVNGSGYPARTRGNAIACEARIAGIVDVFDEIRSAHLAQKRTFEYLRVFIEQYRRDFDPAVARVFMGIFSS